VLRGAKLAGKVGAPGLDAMRHYAEGLKTVLVVLAGGILRGSEASLRKEKRTGRGRD
jgi:hypothetical protein